MEKSEWIFCHPRAFAGEESVLVIVARKQHRTKQEQSRQSIFWPDRATDWPKLVASRFCTCVPMPVAPLAGRWARTRWILHSRKCSQCDQFSCALFRSRTLTLPNIPCATFSFDRCWCGGCDLLPKGPGRFDRHGTASCADYPCSGDATRQCGGYDAFSLYFRGTCGGFCLTNWRMYNLISRKTFEVFL